MFCRSCHYDLAGLAAGRCPECGASFDPSDRRTLDARRRGPQGIIGIGLALLLAVVMVVLLWVALTPDYGYSRHAAFLTVLCIGLGGGVIGAVLAARNRSWWGRVPLLLVGVLCVWAGLFLGSDKGFRVWQSMPDPPAEAFADTGPIGAFLLGWIPGGLVVAVVFGLAILFFEWRRRRRRPRPSSRPA